MREAFARRASRADARGRSTCRRRPAAPGRGVNLDDNVAVREIAEEDPPAGFRAGP